MPLFLRGAWSSRGFSCEIDRFHLDLPVSVLTVCSRLATQLPSTLGSAEPLSEHPRCSPSQKCSILIGSIIVTLPSTEGAIVLTCQRAMVLKASSRSERRGAQLVLQDSIEIRLLDVEVACLTTNQRHCLQSERYIPPPPFCVSFSLLLLSFYISSSVSLSPSFPPSPPPQQQQLLHCSLSALRVSCFGLCSPERPLAAMKRVVLDLQGEAFYITDKPISVACESSPPLHRVSHVSVDFGILLALLDPREVGVLSDSIMCILGAFSGFSGDGQEKQTILSAPSHLHCEGLISQIPYTDTTQDQMVPHSTLENIFQNPQPQALSRHPFVGPALLPSRSPFDEDRPKCRQASTPWPR